MKAISFDFHNALIGEHWKVKIFPFHHSKCHSYLCHQLEQKKDIWWRHLKAGKVEIYNFSRSGLLGFDHRCKYYVNFNARLNHDHSYLLGSYSYVESRLKFVITLRLRQLTNRAFVWVEVIRKTPHVS